MPEIEKIIRVKSYLTFFFSFCFLGLCKNFCCKIYDKFANKVLGNSQQSSCFLCAVQIRRSLLTVVEYSVSVHRG